MVEDLGISDADVRQRKLGKSKNQSDDVLIVGSDNVHVSSNKKRRRGRGGGPEGMKNIIENEGLIEMKEKREGILRKRESDLDGGDDGDEVDDYSNLIDSELYDEESTSSWLFKLTIIVIVVSLGFSLMWFTDGQSSTSDSGEMDINNDVQRLDDVPDGHVPSIRSDYEEGDGDSLQRGDYVESKNGNDEQVEEMKYHDYHNDQENRFQGQWPGDNEPGIIAEVSETIGQPFNEIDDELSESSFKFTPDEVQEVSVDEPTLAQDHLEPFERSDFDLHQQRKQEQEPQEQPFEDQYQTHHDEHEPMENLPYGQYETSYSEQYNQPDAEQFNQPNLNSDSNSESFEGDNYYECPEGSQWDGLSCVKPDEYGQIDESNSDNGYNQRFESNGEYVNYPEQ